MSLIIRRAVTQFKLEDGCRLATPPGIIEGIYAMTAGHPCDDCAMKPCKLLELFQREDKVSKAYNVPVTTGLKTNAELAAELGVSKRQVSRLRIPGTNELRTAE